MDGVRFSILAYACASNPLADFSWDLQAASEASMATLKMKAEIFSHFILLPLAYTVKLESK